MIGTASAIPLLIFFIVSGSLMRIYFYLEKRYQRSILLKRLLNGSSGIKENKKKEPFIPFKGLIYALGRLAISKEEKELTKISTLLGYAGYRSPRAVLFYFGVRASLSVLFGIFYLAYLLITANISAQTMLFTSLPLATGYFLPGLFLKHRIASRQQRIFRELPDALDLLIICMAAGLSFDMSLFRVSNELKEIAPVLSQEFGQYFLEIQSGLPRKDVLNNLSRRNGVSSLNSVVNVLIQSSRFGTDVAEALMVYIKSMRVERRQIAEEKGAKLSTRLTFPMILLILPALLIVLLAPAVINLMERMHAGF